MCSSSVAQNAIHTLIMWSKDEYEVLFQKQIHVTAKDACAVLCALNTLLYGFNVTYHSFMR